MNWILDKTEVIREAIAYWLFPELGFYIKAIKRMAEIDENGRVVQVLEGSDSACADWAINLVEIKYIKYDSMSSFLDSDEE
jgi:hypothetical protein